MKITELIKNNTGLSCKPIISLEIVPPDRGQNIDELFRTIEKMLCFSPSFISITSHPDEVFIKNESDLSSVKIMCKKPGTIGLSSAVKNKFSIEPIPHLLSYNRDPLELEDILIELDFLNIHNLFIIQGDKSRLLAGNQKRIQNIYTESWEVIKHVEQMNRGIYCGSSIRGKPSDFCLGASCYPEKHFSSPNKIRDFEKTKQKLKSGCNFLISQMFFDPGYFLSFKKKMNDFFPEIPIIPGIKPITSLKSLLAIPSKFHVEIPQKILNKMENCRTPEEEWKTGITYTAEILEKLMDNGISCFHFFTMGHGKSTDDLLKAVFNTGK